MDIKAHTFISQNKEINSWSMVWALTTPKNKVKHWILYGKGKVRGKESKYSGGKKQSTN